MCTSLIGNRTGVVNDASADDRQNRVKPFDCLVRHPFRIEKIIAEDDRVCQFAGLDRPKPVFIA